MVGGEIGLFTRLMYGARNEAVERLVGECMGRGGNGILGLRCVKFSFDGDFVWWGGGVARRRAGRGMS